MGKSITNLVLPDSTEVYSFQLPFGTCSTDQATAAKVVDCDSFLLLEAGARILVLFSNGATANATLNVEGTGEKAIKVKGNYTTALSWGENDTVEFVYDGTDWNLIGVGTPIPTISGTVTKAVGGISKDKTYDNASITDVLTDLLFPYVSPSNLSIAIKDASGNSIAKTFEHGATASLKSITPTFTKGSKDITSIKIGTSSGASDIYSGSSATSGTAITLSTAKNYTSAGTVHCTITDANNTILNASASINYAYYDYSKLTTSATAETTGATKQSNSGADSAYNYRAGQYLWLYSRSSGKKIQQYISGSWYDADTYRGDAITLTLASGATATYYPYRTGKAFSKDGNARYRLA